MPIASIGCWLIRDPRDSRIAAFIAASLARHRHRNTNPPSLSINVSFRNPNTIHWWGIGPNQLLYVCLNSSHPKDKYLTLMMHVEKNFQPHIRTVNVSIFSKIYTLEDQIEYVENLCKIWQ